MIRSTQFLSGEITDPTTFVLDHRDEAVKVFEQTANTIRPQALAALSVMPGPVKYPIAWTSEKQRRAFFATDGFGNGIPYKRTGGLARSWKMVTDTAENAANGEFKLQIRNDNKAAKYVFGSLAKTNPGKFQQRFHINTGWIEGYSEVQFWLNAFNVLYSKNLRKRFREMSTEFKSRRRAYSAPRRP